MTLETVQGKPVAKAGPKQTSMTTTSSPTDTLPCHKRDWIDVEPGQYDKICFEVSKKMIRLLRHDFSVLREEDGAVEFRILAPMFRSEFTSSRTSTRKGLRRDEAKDCSVQTLLANTPKQGLLRVKDCSSIKRDQTRSSFTTPNLRCASRRW